MPDSRLARPEWRGRSNVDAYTIAWIEHAEQIVRERWPEIAHALQVTKGGYQPAADGDSADTHTRGGGTDFVWCHPECLLALRMAGGFVWHRVKTASWNDHMHGAPIGHPFMAPGLARQEIAYFNGRDGLANNGPDNGPRLNPTPRPIWPWPLEETDMFTDSDRAMLTKLLKKAENSGARERATNALLRRIRKDVAGLPADVAAEIDTALLQD